MNPESQKINEFKELARNGEEIFSKKCEKPTIFSRVILTYGMVAGVYPRVMLTVKNGGGRYTYRASEPMRRMRIRFRHFEVPAGETAKLTFLCDDEDGIIRDVNIKVDLRERVDT